MIASWADFLMGMGTMFILILLPLSWVAWRAARMAKLYSRTSADVMEELTRSFAQAREEMKNQDWRI